MQDCVSELNCGEFSWKGYMKIIRDFVCKSQLLDENTWELFLNQYRNKTDSDCKWRGEYWGKMMRGACLTYKCTKNKKLYKTLENTVRELLSIQEESGRFSTYPIEKEFSSWDMWCRKYILLGNIYFYEICTDEQLKTLIIKALSRHLDFIIDHVGAEKNKIDILDTSDVLEGLNSSSILEPVVKMYELTKNENYLKFAEYIISRGFTKSQNIIEFLSNDNNFPYQCNVKKAYEMMSCFQGLLEYAKVTDNKEYCELVVKLVKKIHESDITIIGTAGCRGEFFDNSAITQTNFNEDDMQETCVTVTWINLCYQLLKLTGSSVYADYIEKSVLNAMHGAVNLLNQNGKFAKVWSGTSDAYDTDKHEVFPFDSYSPLYQKRRGTGIGGFNRMENNRSYGCCACIGSAGTALGEIFGILKKDDTIFINLYNDGIIKTKINDNKLKINIKNGLSLNDDIKIKISGKGNYSVALRLPYWSDTYKVYINKRQINADIKNGYIILTNNWNNDLIELTLDAKVKIQTLNNKIAFSYGPYVLARDERFSENIFETVSLDEQNIKYSFIKNRKFLNNKSLKIKTNNGDITLCDYASAGKNFDEDKSKISVWLDRYTEASKTV